MAALARRFNRRIYDCRWLLIPAARRRRQKPDGRQPHFKSQCDSMAVFLLLLPDTRYRHLHGSQIDKAIAALGGTSTATRRNETLCRSSTRICSASRRPMPPAAARWHVYQRRKGIAEEPSITCLKLRARLPKPRAASTQPYRSSAARHVQPCLLTGRLSVARNALESRYRPNAVRRWLARMVAVLDAAEKPG
jgi:hypothetical protein